MGGRRGGSAGDGRFGLLLLALAAVLLAVAVRLVTVQAVDAREYAKLASEQRRREVTLPPWRGAIYDREGEPLAVSQEARTVYATPYAVADPAQTAAAIANVLGGDAAHYEKLLRRKSGFVYIARKVDVDRAASLEALELPGIAFEKDSRRAYPCGELACQVLGFVGVDDEGLAGVEKQYDSLLAGKAGHLIAERDPKGRIILGGVSKREEPVDGEDIVLTIDKDIQYEAQVRIAEAVKRWRAKSGSVIVMDPRSGEVLALASTPGYDPNRYRSANQKAFRNRPVSDTYEPGSTIKTFTAAAAIDRGLATPKTVYTLPPTIKAGGRTIHESHPRGTVKWTLTKIVTQSSNVGAVKVGMKLGPRGLASYFSRFGLLEKTGIDFPGEAKGWMPPIGQWSPSTIANVPFGQGISVTPLQLARALSAIANGGELVTPHLLAGVRGRDDVAPSWPKRRAVSEKTARTTAELLRAVVTEGTGSEAAVNGYTVAGKTGTAQKARTDGRGYAGGGYVGSFSGFLPVEDPRVLIVVTLDEPKDAIYGGTVAAPVFSRLGAFAMSHLKVPPTSETPTAGITAEKP